MRSTKQWLTVAVLWLTVSGQAALAQSQETTTPARGANVAQLLKDLRWHDQDSHQQYLKIRAERTNRLLSELDGFIAETVSARVTAASVTTGLDSLLGHKKGDAQDSAAFQVTLPVGRFLVIGVELTRGGGAIPENAFSLRAYRDNGTSFVFVSATDFQDEVSGPNEDHCWYTCASLQIQPLSTRPVGNEFWFLAWADVSSFVPPIQMMRLFAFDGDHFRIVWAPKDFQSEFPVVEPTVDGFSIRKLFDPIGGWPPSIVIHEQYALTVDGPQKTGEWEEPRR
jgi:hypothetical protein